MSSERLWEIRWHGRGGQGTVTAAKLLCVAAYQGGGGMKGVQAIPFIGAERRGSPVKAFNRISPEPVRIWSAVRRPNVVVLIDPLAIVRTPDVVLDGLVAGGRVVVNTEATSLDLNGRNDLQVWAVDATGVSLELDLRAGADLVLNSPMLGALAKAVPEMVSLDHVQRAISEEFGRRGELNCKAAELAYERCRRL
ncbi:MAG: 2-oxoacid:acceptor oxidoreductase family protein [Phycisphaerae bacterium]|nr:2-oxoacid:acceptor oxidoreductase family protein [Phycisphaerae bacterium]